MKKLKWKYTHWSSKRRKKNISLETESIITKRMHNVKLPKEWVWPDAYASILKILGFIYEIIVQKHFDFVSRVLYKENKKIK